MNNTRDVRVGQAVAPYCNKQKAWLLPSGKKQTDRRVYKREIAVIFCHRLAQLIGGVV
jgi:hypothetical protein